MQSHGTGIRATLIALFAAASLYFNFTLLQVAKSVYAAHGTQLKPTKPLDSYTFIGSDYPNLLPISTPHIKMTVEESVHYSLTDPEAYAEWLYTAPLGDNDIRLGPDKRVFAVAMFHELHCLRGIREALVGGLASLNAAKQDVTLEPGDFVERNFTTDRVGATHTCRDWAPIYEMVNAKWIEWEHFRDAHGLPPFIDEE